MVSATQLCARLHQRRFSDALLLRSYYSGHYLATWPHFHLPASTVVALSDRADTL